MKIQWLGHSAFKVMGANACVLIDPFLSGNPKFTGTIDKAAEGVGHVLLTHAHNDHVGDTLAILDRTGATLVTMVELAGYLGSALHGAKSIGLNYGGTHHTHDGLEIALVPAWHTSSYSASDGSIVDGGMPAGVVLKIDGHTILHMGDTTIFSDMALINEIYRPDIGIVPIGGHYTMDARVAALAVNRYFDFDTILPCHYLTFPSLAQSADAFVAAVTKGTVLTPAPMETVEI
ncbi:MAG: metal-dependent hydrolase [Alphaproteobacteria bacterium]|nr:metal-dependent hydrolase [Alphaproteobacteria bacterium]